MRATRGWFEASLGTLSFLAVAPRKIMKVRLLVHKILPTWIAIGKTIAAQPSGSSRSSQLQ
jgi:hypothetical protein